MEVTVQLPFFSENLSRVILEGLTTTGLPPSFMMHWPAYMAADVRKLLVTPAGGRISGGSALKWRLWTVMTTVTPGTAFPGVSALLDSHGRVDGEASGGALRD